MRKFIVIIFSLLFFIIVQPAFARSGCCSHHGGVCGCGCCDGSPLSATCAPYYPQCDRAITTTVPVYVIPTSTPIPYIRPTNTPTPTSTPTPTPAPSPTAVVLDTKEKGNTKTGLIALLVFGGLGIGIARFIIRKGTTIVKN